MKQGGDTGYAAEEVFLGSCSAGVVGPLLRTVLREDPWWQGEGTVAATEAHEVLVVIADVWIQMCRGG